MHALAAIAHAALDRSPASSIQARSPAPLAPANAARIPMNTGIWARTDLVRQMELIRHHPIIYSIIQRRTADAAKIPWALYRNPQRRERLDPDDDREEVPQHSALRVWRRPNAVMTPTGRSFRQLLLTYYELTGEMIVVADHFQGTRLPRELYPIRPDRVQPIPDPWDFRAGWVYYGPEGQQVPLSNDQVWQAKFANPLDPQRGLSPLVAAMIDIDASLLTSEWYRSFYANDATPGGIVTAKSPMTKPQFEEWMRRWNQQHGGVSNANRVALMDADTSWSNTTMSMVDQQMAEMIERSDSRLRETMSMSKTLLGATEDVNRATAEAAQLVYGAYALDDRVTLLRELANGPLLGSYEAGRADRAGDPPRMLFDVTTSLVPDNVEDSVKDRDSRVNMFDSAVRAGADPGEAWEMAGFDPLDFEKPEPPPPALPPGQPSPPGLPPAGDDVEEDDGDVGALAARAALLLT